MLAAGVGNRLGLGEDGPPKALLGFNGETLLKRHLDILTHFGLTDLTLVVGHQASAIERELGASAPARACGPASIRTTGQAACCRFGRCATS